MNSDQPAGNGGNSRVILRAALKLAVWFTLLVALDRIAFQVLKMGYDRYFGLDKNCEVVFVGNSRTALGVDHKLVEKQIGRSCGKFALNGANASNRLAMIQHLLETHPSCDTIVFDVSGYSFNDKNLSAAAYTLLFPYMGSKAIDQHIQEKAVSRHESFSRQLFHLPRFSSTTLNLAIRGWLRRDDNLKSNEVDLDRVQHRINTGRIQSFEQSPDGRELFAQTAKVISSADKRLVLLHMPMVKMLNDVDREMHDRNIAVFQRLCKENDWAHFIDMNTDFEERYDLMFDGIHLNAKGKKVVSGLIASELHATEKD